VIAPADWIADAVGALKPLATVNEACDVLRTSSRNLRRMIATGRLKALRARESGSSRVLIPRVEIESYLRSLEVQS
jgi:excisionase family DNA binding protein